MSEAPPPIDRDEEMLSELAELDMALARKVHTAAMAAEEPKTIADLRRTYQRISRSLRQTLALKAQLRLQRQSDARAATPSPATPRPATPRSLRADREEATYQRWRALTGAVERVIWNEREPLDAPEAIMKRLDR